MGALCSLCSKTSRDEAFYRATECIHYYKPQTRTASLLLRAGADVNMSDELGYTALMRVARRGHAKCLKMLLKTGADVNAVNFNGSTALCIAAWNYNRECVDMLIEAGGRVGNPNKWAKTMKATSCLRHEKLLRLLLEEGADVNTGDVDGTPLTLTVRYGNMSFVKLLVELGADVNSTNYQGRTPVMCAAGAQNFDCVEFLIDKGADVNASDREGNNALTAAAGYGVYTSPGKKCTKLILQQGARVDKALYVSNSSRTIAHTFDHEGFMLLYAAGVDIDETVTEHGTEIVQEKQTLTLMNICREAIREHLLNVNPVSLFGTIPQLGLPPLITSYLLYNVALTLSE